MCRLIALSCDDFIAPAEPIAGLDAMCEGYKGAGFGLLLRDLGGPFQEMKSAPILSGIFSNDSLKLLDQFMLQRGFTTKYKISFKLAATPPMGTPKRGVYLIRAYECPAAFEDLSPEAFGDQLMQMRLDLRRIGRKRHDMKVFSFWPDTIMIKEIGHPTALAEYMGLTRIDLQARIILAQEYQRLNCTEDLYACPPFFLQGYATMTNGENTAFMSNREFLTTRGFAGYDGYRSDAEIFTHTLHYTVSRLGLGIEAYKHVITPLAEANLRLHADARFLTYLRYACRHLVIDGPNCVVGCLPDNTLFMAQDRKKLRPGIVGGVPGKYGFASQVCGLDAVMPERNCRRDYQPRHLETVVVGPDRHALTIIGQQQPLLSN